MSAIGGKAEIALISPNEKSLNRVGESSVYRALALRCSRKIEREKLQSVMTVTEAPLARFGKTPHLSGYVHFNG
jgi:hypothetical protein